MTATAMQQIAHRYMSAARGNRRRVFLRHFVIDPRTRLLDLGSEDGSAIHKVLQGQPYVPANIFIADLDQEVIDRGQARYRFTPVRIGESGVLPFADGHFDIVYASSVIEHVTVPKDAVYAVASSREFRQQAQARQQQFAAEIRRTGKGYFVQTPNRDFPIEAHTWMPFVGWLPRELQIPLIRFLNRFWIKKTQPDFHLLTRAELASLFPEARIVSERSLGLVKSWMAIKSDLQ
jgi:SAM-dependent methyltransferase